MQTCLSELVLDLYVTIFAADETEGALWIFGHSCPMKDGAVLLVLTRSVTASQRIMSGRVRRLGDKTPGGQDWSLQQVP